MLLRRTDEGFHEIWPVILQLRLSSLKSTFNRLDKIAREQRRETENTFVNITPLLQFYCSENDATPLFGTEVIASWEQQNELKLKQYLVYSHSANGDRKGCPRGCKIDPHTNFKAIDVTVIGLKFCECGAQVIPSARRVVVSSYRQSVVDLNFNNKMDASKNTGQRWRWLNG